MRTLDTRRYLKDVVKDAISSYEELPPGWEAYDHDDAVWYYNSKTDELTTKHPCDQETQKKVESTKLKVLFIVLRMQYLYRRMKKARGEKCSEPTGASASEPAVQEKTQEEILALREKQLLEEKRLAEEQEEREREFERKKEEEEREKRQKELLERERKVRGQGRE